MTKVLGWVWLQLFMGLEGGLEDGIHGMCQDKDTEVLIQVDAKNSFNSIKRMVLLHNKCHYGSIVCPRYAEIMANVE